MFYKFARSLFKLFFLIFFRLKVSGKEKIPAKGPLIVCSNHFSWLDPPLVACTIDDRQLFFMAKAELFKIFILSFIIRKLGAFPVKRDTADRRAIKHAFKLLEEGKSLGLFPEGTRSKTGETQTPFNGVAFLAIKSGAPVLPVGIKGPYKFRKPVEVNIGEPLRFTEENCRSRGRKLTDISENIMQEIKQLTKVC
ncbi:MAG: lysophospholipid acyltransferase family protein [Dethiobacteria bacterium]|jgi:1-acyl-sn-glycerol-3-phosphate acyltransferase